MVITPITAFFKGMHRPSDDKVQHVVMVRSELKKDGRLEYPSVAYDVSFMLEEIKKLYEEGIRLLSTIGENENTPNPGDEKHYKEVHRCMTKDMEINFLLNDVRELGDGRGPKKQFSNLLWEELIVKLNYFVEVEPGSGCYVPNPHIYSPTQNYFCALGGLYFKFLFWHYVYLSKSYLKLPLSPTFLCYLFSYGEYRFSIKDIERSNKDMYDKLVDVLVMPDDAIEEIDPEYNGCVNSYVEGLAKKHFDLPSPGSLDAGVPESWFSFKKGFAYFASVCFRTEDEGLPLDLLLRQSVVWSMSLHLPKVARNNNLVGPYYFNPWLMIEELSSPPSIDKDELWEDLHFEYILIDGTKKSGKIPPGHKQDCCQKRIVQCTSHCMRSLFCRYLNEISPQETANFVLWLSGEKHSGQYMIIEINVCLGIKSLPRVATCSRTMTIPDYCNTESGYSSDEVYSIFKNKLSTAIGDCSLGLV